MSQAVLRAMHAPFGDYHLESYSVACELAEIRLRARRMFPGEPRITEIVFLGVAAYHFEHDNFGTILSHIVEVPLDAFLQQHAEQLNHGWKQSGWPRFWRESMPEALAQLQRKSVRAYELTSACGMQGWVLACIFQTQAVDSKASKLCREDF